ncbi:MAG: hypothetical protein H7Z20_03500 [Bdellovibrio sp.]|nr:hypothetical protein [Methylotenera sp.]
MLFIIFRTITVIAAICLLSGCLGGSIATQIVSTIATKMADRAIANAMDVQDGPSHRKQSYDYNSYASNSAGNLAVNKSSDNQYNSNSDIAKNNALNNAANIPPNSHLSNPPSITSGDRYQNAIINMAFAPAKPAQELILDQALPLQSEETQSRIAITEGNPLVRVELFNLLIGDEKNAVFEKARLLGAISLPKKREWQHWGVGTGAFKQEGQNDKKIITFLIPPEFGKLPSGSITMVELASPGELNVARYKSN